MLCAFYEFNPQNIWSQGYSSLLFLQEMQTNKVHYEIMSSLPWIKPNKTLSTDSSCWNHINVTLPLLSDIAYFSADGTWQLWTIWNQEQNIQTFDTTQLFNSKHVPIMSEILYHWQCIYASLSSVHYIDCKTVGERRWHWLYYKKCRCHCSTVLHVYDFKRVFGIKADVKVHHPSHPGLMICRIFTDAQEKVIFLAEESDKLAEWVRKNKK